MAKTLSLTWTNPIPHATCGYQAFYRRKGDPDYIEILTSGNTSGTTHITAQVAAPADFEGFIISDCCNESLSSQAPFGINSYSIFKIGVINNSGTQQYIATVTSGFPNSYKTLIQGTFQSTSDGTVPFNLTYPSGSTTTEFVIGTAGHGAVVSNVVVSSFAPIFDYGGELQQFDAFATPPYFQFFWDGSSGVTWNGSPASLPSFTLDAFNITEQDQENNTLQGNLLISWIYDSVFADAAAPFNRVTLELFDPGNNLLGQVTISPTSVGLRNSAIVMNRSSNTYPLTNSTQFTMIAKWDDESIIDTHTFYLPI